MLLNRTTALLRRLRVARAALGTIVLLSCACTEAVNTRRTSSPQFVPNSERRVPSASAPPESVATTETPRVFSRARLLELKPKWKPLGDGSLACDEDGGQCICLVPLGCGDHCVTYDKAVARFREALDHPTGGRTVYCELAETGRCGGFRYFLFRGDIHRNEVMWFNAIDGHLVGARSWTDYDAYCDHGAALEVMGDIPDCESVERTELICGDGPSPRLPATDFLH